LEGEIVKPTSSACPFQLPWYRFVGAKSLKRADSCAVTYNEWQSESFAYFSSPVSFWRRGCCFCGISLRHQFAASVCGISLRHQFAASVCGISLRHQFAASVCGIERSYAATDVLARVPVARSQTQRESRKITTVLCSSSDDRFPNVEGRRPQARQRFADTQWAPKAGGLKLISGLPIPNGPEGRWASSSSTDGP
jgi:hypothetical protein